MSTYTFHRFLPVSIARMLLLRPQQFGNHQKNLLKHRSLPPTPRSMMKVIGPQAILKSLVLGQTLSSGVITMPSPPPCSSQHLETFCTVATGVRKLLGISMSREARMRLKILHCTGQPTPPTKNYSAPNVNSAEIEKLCPRRMLLKHYHASIPRGLIKCVLADCTPKVSALLGLTIYILIKYPSKGDAVGPGLPLGEQLTRTNAPLSRELCLFCSLLPQQQCDIVKSLKFLIF